jgi:O-antigen ligase
MTKGGAKNDIMKYLKYIYLGIFLIPLIWNPWGGNEMYETAKVSFALFFIGGAFIYIAISLFKNRESSIRTNRTILVLLGLWLGSFAVSTILSIAPAESFWGLYKRLQGTFTYLLYAANFLICLSLFNTEKFKKSFLNIVLFGGALTAIYAVSQRFGFDPFIKGPVDMLAGRSFATMGSPVSLGQFLIFPWFVSFVLFIDECKKKNTRNIVLQLLLLVLFSLAVYFSLNRGSLLGIAVAVAIWGVTKIKTPRATWIAACVLILLTFGGLWFYSSQNFGNSKLMSSRSLGSRAVLWESAVPLIPEHLLLGSGPETTYQTIQKTLSPEIYHYERMMDIPDRVHNTFLETILTRGLVGLAVLLITIGIILRLAFKEESDNTYAQIGFLSLVAYFISIQFGFSLVTHGIFLSAMAALFFAGTMNFKTYKVKLRFIVGLVLIVLAAACFNYSVKFIKTEYIVARGLDAFFQSDKNAVKVFDEARQTLPYFREIPYMTFSLFDDEAHENPETLNYVGSAIKNIVDISRNSFYTHLTQAKLATLNGDNKTAWAEYGIAAIEAPNWPGVWYKWGVDALAAGDKKMAQEKFVNFINLAPVYGLNEAEAKRIFDKSNPILREVHELLNTTKSPTKLSASPP